MLFSKGIIDVFCCTAAQILDDNTNCSNDTHEITCFLKNINLKRNNTWQHVLGRGRGPADEEHTTLRNSVFYLTLYRLGHP